MENDKILFELIRNDNFKMFKELIHTKEIFDINVRDNSNNYLITYAIVKNNIEIIKLLLDKECRIDIRDQEGKSILYLPIKYNYNEIIKLLIEHDKHSIGISIVDITDIDEKIPLHYAIQFTNNYAIDILLNANSNVNYQDKNGNNALHLAVKSKEYDSCKKILSKDIHINAINNIGETALHIACNLKFISIIQLLIDNGIDINIRENKTNMTALIYAVNRNNIDSVKLLMNNKINTNLQDFIGNTAISYSIIDDFNEITYELIKSKPNVNLHNIDGNLPIHLLLEKDNIYENEITKFLIDQSNLNFQNNVGNTPLHFICQKDLWKTYKNILIKKKLNIFVSNSDHKRPVDYINKNDLDEFMEMTVKSYLYILRNSNFIWKENWENICNKELFYEKLNDEQLQIVKKYISKTHKDSDNKKDICHTIILHKIQEIYKNNDQKCGYTSYPQKKFKQCIDIDNLTNVEVCTFTGETLEILIGVIYLLSKHKYACSTIEPNFKTNNDMCNYFLSLGMRTTNKCEFLNFEIVWVHKKLFFSDNFANNFRKCIDNNNIRFIIIPLGIEIERGSHANYLIFDKKTYEMERFEPYGSESPYKFNYNQKLLDNILSFKFTEIDPNIKYISPDNFLPKIGFQYFDIYEEKTSKIGDPSGFCALWSLWYTDMRMKYPDINRKSLVNKLLKEIKFKNISFRHMIRNYSINITDIRDKIFKAAGITINDWLNDHYTEKQYELIIKELSKLLKQT
ncbi:ankyrin repeat protein [Klosneuvirus KNV1]|uniref:Ankyrin repeat protein n=1 Tax=Klosneuvirus KNV1 TaxID=1977640 RepID=A0A1V0SJ54_9VIRU|nr:ankyrin repeat protein [Klosneuvirus KNV1]